MAKTNKKVQEGKKKKNRKPGLPTDEEINKICASEESTLDFLWENGVLVDYRKTDPTTRLKPKCPFCKTGTVSVKEKGKKTWRCNNRKECPKKQWSFFYGSFFYNAQLKCNDILRLCWKQLAGVSYTSSYNLSKHASSTITNYYAFVRQLVVEGSIMKDGDTMRQIGGVDADGQPIKVQIDEILFGKSKYNRGRVADGVWVFGGVEYIDHRVRGWFAVLVDDRKKTTLLPLIRKYIAPGSHVISDGWAAYKKIKDMKTIAFTDVHEGMYLNDDRDYEQLALEIAMFDEQPLYAKHDMVNHSENFVDPTTKEHTNACKGHWGGLKKQIPPKNRNRYQLEEFFVFIRWKDENWGRLWESFINLLCIVTYMEGAMEEQPVQTPQGMGNRAQFR